MISSSNIVMHIFDVFFNMVWQIYWPLTFGLMLSSFIRRQLAIETVIKHLGQTNLRSISFTTLLGMMSSSCSYAAASISHTLLIKKATVANAMAFLVSSTNLILEMFIVLVALLGWTFLWGEILGGLLLICIVAVLFQCFYPKDVEAELRSKLESEEEKLPKDAPMGDCGMEMKSDEHHLMSMDESSEMDMDMDMDKMEPMKDDAPPLSTAVKNAGGVGESKITQAASSFHMDLGMIGKEILIGVVVSSILIATVPLEGWRDLFISSDTNIPAWLHSLLDVLIGIGVAVIAYVCSVGNLLLAAALWHGGISFGGVIGFILSDVLTIPMMRVYWKYYGARPAKWMVGLLFVSILLTGLSIDAIFLGLDIHASSASLRPLIQDGFGWNFTSVMNFIFIPVSIWFYFVGKKANAGMAMNM